MLDHGHARCCKSAYLKTGSFADRRKSFYPYDNIPHHCIIKGDGKYMSIAAASILAKTHRDQFMENMDQQYPGYGFAIHKGYPTSAHREAISKLGPCILHRKTFRLLPEVSPLLLFE